ncbi:hypothetical protein SPAN111604_09580 [Sphingomonas antarctica]|uniref:DUF4167 domain-containing protein n=1 Tax=Sphingomonas antarctica TaxID=2040274 RepID=UPI0039EAA804
MLNTLMNVRQQSGRRRGRGGGQNRQGGNGRGPESGNRIDNRARGNAPQLLEKYKGLARDAQQAGDRVLMEYYLQFADHYFRVVSESRTRQDEQRQPRGDGQGNDGDDGDDGQDGQDDGEDDFGFKLPPRQEQPRRDDRPREDRPQQQQRDDRPREDRGQRDDRPRNDQPREDRSRQEQRPREDRPYNGNAAFNGNAEQQARGPQTPRFAEEPEDAPRRRELPPRRERAPRAEDGGPASFDTSVLPPAIGSSVSDVPELPMGMEGEPIDLPAPKKRGRPRKDASAVPASEG